MGRSYLLACPEGGRERLEAAVQRVDEAMCKIRDAGKIRARDRIAVLAALNLAFDALVPAEARPEEAAAGALDPDNQTLLSALLERLDALPAPVPGQR